MLFLKFNIVILFLLLGNFSFGQFSVQSNIGIENPYEYEYHFNATPQTKDYNYRDQKFNFFRTKIVSIGIIYDYTPSIFNKRLSLISGANIGYMHQFIADTIISPKLVGLLYNVRHTNTFFAPEISLRFKTYKIISLTAGIEGFIPFQKRILSEQENFLFTRDLGEGFYPNTLYYSFGMEFNLNKIKLGVKFQGSGASDHWVKYRLIDLLVDHDLQRWMINLKYEL